MLARSKYGSSGVATSVVARARERRPTGSAAAWRRGAGPRRPSASRVALPADARLRRARARPRSGRCPARARRCASRGAARPRPRATRRRTRPTTTFEQLCVRAYSTTSAAGVARRRGSAVFAPNSCASLTRPQDPLALARRQPLQRRRLDVDGGPVDAELRRRAAPRCARRRRRPAPGPMQQSSESSVFQTRSIAWSERYAWTSSSTRSAVRRSASSRSAIRLPLRKKLRRGPLDLLGQVHLAGREARQQVVGRHVDHHHLVGLVEERVGHRLPDVDAGDAADDVVQALDVLHVERREDVDAGGQQLVDVLPALRMARARHVRVRELVDQDQRRTPRQRRIEIELRQRAVLVRDLRARQDLEALQQRLGLLAAVRLEQTRRRRPCLRCAAARAAVSIAYVLPTPADAPK